VTQISAASHLLALMQAHLDRLEKARGKAPSRREASNKQALDSVARAKEILQSDALSEEEVAQVVVTGLLARELGPEVSEDPKFQQMVRDIVATLNADPSSHAILKAAISQLKDMNSAPQG